MIKKKNNNSGHPTGFIFKMGPGWIDRWKPFTGCRVFFGGGLEASPSHIPYVRSVGNHGNSGGHLPHLRTRASSVVLIRISGHGCGRCSGRMGGYYGDASYSALYPSSPTIRWLLWAVGLLEEGRIIPQDHPATCKLFFAPIKISFSVNRPNRINRK